MVNKLSAISVNYRPQWEYLVARHSVQLADTLNESMNRLGDLGWELVQMDIIGAIEFLVVFKRRKENNE